MALFLALLALAQARDDDRMIYSMTGFGMVFLARHQLPDGSWGEQSGACVCPFQALPLDEPDRARFDAQLALLEDDDPAVRSRAQRALWYLGPGAISLVREASIRGPIETRSRCRELLRERHRFAAPGDRKTTSLGLLCCLWAGQTPDSPDVYRKVPMGRVVQRGLDWLVERQSDAALSDPVSEALSALALSEAAACTESAPLKRAATLGLERVARLRSDETEVLAWSVLLRMSAARRGAVETVKPDLRRIRALLAERSESLARSVVYLCDLWSDAVPDVWAAAESLEAEPLEPDPTAFFFSTLVFLNVFGPSELSIRWCDNGVKLELLESQRGKRGCDEGGWMCTGSRGTFRKTALLTMAGQIYYHYQTSPAAWDPPCEESSR